MKDFFVRLLEKPALYIFTLGLLCALLAAAGTISWYGQTLAVADPAWRIALAALGTLLVLLGAALIARDSRNPRPSRPLKLDYEVFLASPMSALSDTEAFEAERKDIVRIKNALKEHAGIGSIYDAGEKLQAGKWNPKDFAAEVDLEAPRHSRYFVLIYPAKLASSVLFEAGYAIGMGKPSFYIVRNTGDLPFLMQEANNLSRRYPQVRIWLCADADAIVDRIERLGTRIFAAREADEGGG